MQCRKKDLLFICLLLHIAAYSCSGSTGMLEPILAVTKQEAGIHPEWVISLSQGPQTIQTHTGSISVNKCIMQTPPKRGKVHPDLYHWSFCWEATVHNCIQYPGCNFRFSILLKVTSTCRPQWLGIDPLTFWSLERLLQLYHNYL